MLYEQFKDRIGELASVKYIIFVTNINFVDDEGNEYILPKENQIPSDFFRKGDNVKER